MLERDLDHALQARYDSRFSDPAPSRLGDRILAIPSTTPQQRSWLPPFPRFHSMFSTTKFVVAGVIVALFGGFLLSGVLTQQKSEDAAPIVGASASAEAEADPTVEASWSLPTSSAPEVAART